MKLTVIVKNPKDRNIIINEFFNDNIIFLDDNVKRTLIGDNYEKLYPRDLDFLLKIEAIRRYKNVVFINSCGVNIKGGLRDEILELTKIKSRELFLSDIKTLNDCDIFFSKKCPKCIKEMYNDYLLVEDINILRKPLYLKKGIIKYDFENIDLFNGLESLCEIASITEKIEIINLPNDEDYKKYLKNKDTFYLFVSEDYFCSWGKNSEFYFCGVKSLKDFLFIDDEHYTHSIKGPDGKKLKGNLSQILEVYCGDN